MKLGRLFVLAASLHLLISASWTSDLFAQESTLRIEITEGVITPLPIAIPEFAAGQANSRQVAKDITAVVAADLTGSGIFREIPASAHLATVRNFEDPVQFSDWRVINAEALVIGAVRLLDGGRLEVSFRLYDVFVGAELGAGQRLGGRQSQWRRIAHRISDAIYSRLTGETGYFDSRVAYVAESGPKDARIKRLAVMDYDGANHEFLTEGEDIVLAPRFSPSGDELIFTSYRRGEPEVFVMNLASGESRLLIPNGLGMSFAPRFSPDGGSVVLSLTSAGNTDIHVIDLATGARRQLTTSLAIDTAPSFSPDGRNIVFESDRGGRKQLYVVPSTGGRPARISRAQGQYGTPVWSPRGDQIAFTKIDRNRFHIGVMRTDGTREKLLTESFLDEGPTWSPNGRVLMFFRESRGRDGAPSLFSVDLTGRNLRGVDIPGFGSDPAWSRLRIP